MENSYYEMQANHSFPKSSKLKEENTNCKKCSHPAIILATVIAVTLLIGACTCCVFEISRLKSEVNSLRVCLDDESFPPECVEFQMIPNATTAEGMKMLLL